MISNNKNFDAIVVGTGMAGGWAAKELTEKGLSTLVLERGRMIEHPKYQRSSLSLFGNDKVSEKELKDYEKQSRTGYTIRKSVKHWWVKDSEHPYSELKRFDWIRGYHVGGRSITWGRQCNRMSALDFEANKMDGVGVDWPIRYDDLSSWYDYVEKFIGVSGTKENWPTLPDGIFQSAMNLHPVEAKAKGIVDEQFHRLLTIGRVAHITDGLPGSGRGTCKQRNKCMQGCPDGAYFSSLSSTLPAAKKTGKMELRPNSTVYEVIYDELKQRATGVRIIDSVTGERHEFKARIIFLCASTLNSTFILMNSVSSRFPNGMGNDSGELGHNLMDHHFMAGAMGNYEGVKSDVNLVNRPNGIVIARYRNVGNDRAKYLRGFSYQGIAYSRGVHDYFNNFPVKTYLPDPVKGTMMLVGFGEMLPDHDNKVLLNNSVKDIHGLPTLTFDCEFKENEKMMRVDMANDAAEMLSACDLKDVTTFDDATAPGQTIHEMGTARMGHDPKTSVLNKWNQIHSCRNVFVTDGACMSSSGCVGPSLTYMALTARAADFAGQELKKFNL